MPPFTTAAREIARTLQRHPHPMAQEVARALRIAATQPPRAAALAHFPPVGAALQSQLDDLLSPAQPAAHPLIPALAAVHPHLSWRAAGGGKSPVLGAVELAGPDGALDSDTVRAGLYYQPPHYFYPRHQHAAEEIYLPLIGEAEWHADGAPPRQVAPGTLIHHKENQPHATRTQDDSLLAIWAWRGDLSMETYRFT